MATFVLVPGAGGMASYWSRVVPLLREAGHTAIAVDLPADDEKAGLATYADLVCRAIGDARDVVLVAQSLGGFTAPLVCERVKVKALVFVNAMIPEPGEKVGDWGEHTGSTAARREAARKGGYSEEFEDQTYFFHDVPPEIAKPGDEERAQSEHVFGETCEFAAWPEVPTHVIVGRDDRLFPLEFQRGVAKARLGVDIEEVPGGHLVALAYPRELADHLLADA